MSNSPKEYGTSPVGRLIMGDPFTKQTKDPQGRDLAPDKYHYFIGIAVEKTAPGVEEMFTTMQRAAVNGYGHAPHVQQIAQQGVQCGPNVPFSWKVQDGDEQVVDQKTGQYVPRNKHAAGCWIFKFSTQYDIRPCKYLPNTAVPVDCDRSEIQRGFFVQLSFSCHVNGNVDHTAGVYLNPSAIALVAFGEPIVNGPSLEQQFAAGTGGYMPAGASQTPLAPTGGQPMQQPAQPMQQPAQPMQQPAQPMQQPAQPMQQPAQPMQQPGNAGNPAAMPAQMPAAPVPAGGAMPPAQPSAGAPAGSTASPTNGAVPPGTPGYGGYMNG